MPCATLHAILGFFTYLLASTMAGCGSPTVTVSLSFDGRGLKEARVIDGPIEAKVAMIDVRGIISDGGQSTFLGKGPNPVDRFVAALSRAERDSEVKAILIRISSPGGTVAGSDTAYRELRRFAEKSKKPVVASVGELAASGGYYLALGADEIYAEPSSIVGSIGVIIPTINFSEGLGRIGVHSRSIKSGPNKDLANPLEPMRDSQYAVLQGLVDEFYARFKGLVIERRPGLAGENVAIATDGRIFSGSRAKELGLIDQVGGLREAFDAAKSRAGLKAARLVKYVEPGTAAQSPYAAQLDPPRTQVNLVQLNLDTFAQDPGTSGIYYLWLPTE